MTGLNNLLIISAILFVACLLQIVDKSYGVSLNEDLTLSKSQKEALDKFKARVSSRVEKDYQKSDIYLIRWLRARNFDVRAAEEMLISDLKWRKAQGMDNIQEEDWTDMEEDFPWYYDGYDNEGKPILTANYDEWDIRKGVVAGKLQRIMRWMAYALDTGVRRVRELQAEGKNVTQWDFIINMNNFNLIQHGCIQCLPIYTTFVTNYENHFPGSADKILLLNTPQVFEIVLNIIRPVMSQQTRDALKVYNNNKEEWEPIVFNDIGRDQLVKEYGGTKVRN